MTGAARLDLRPGTQRTFLVLWGVTVLFPLRSSMVVLGLGRHAYMLLMPCAEAAAQPIRQRAVPYERQGRVFGFAVSVERSASPLTAVIVGPLARLVVIPVFSDGAGADAIGGWFGTGSDRGIALVFVVAGVVGLAATVVALGSRPYCRLSEPFDAGPAPDFEPGRG